MARRVQYGQTWWGKAWVEALERIDYNTNRLPRGKSYARKGAVTDIDYSGSKITARVLGSYHSFYKITISLTSFTSADKDKLCELLSARPHLAAELDLGRVPPELLPLAREQDLELLPSSWNDLKAKCSCPDWANPCKHLAAVYYKLAAEIDKNPLLLLQLRGISQKDLAVVAPALTAPGIEEKFVAVSKLDPSEVVPTLPPLDLGESSGRSLINLLGDNPVFVEDGNFKQTLLTAYHNVAQAVGSLEMIDMQEELVSLKTRFSFLLDKPTGEQYSSWQFPVEKDPAARLQPALISQNGELEQVQVTGRAVDTDQLLDYHLHAPLLSSDQNYPAENIFLSQAAAIALLLAERHMFLPENTADPNGDFTVSYVPSFHTNESEQLRDFLIKSYPLQLISNEQRQVLPKEIGVTEILKLFLTRLVHLYSDIGRPACQITRAFFEGSVFRVTQYDQIHSGKAITNWLAALSLPEERVTPVLGVIPLSQEEFTLSLEVHPKDNPLAKSVPISRVMRAKKQVLGLAASDVKKEVIRQVTIAQQYFPSLQLFLQGAESLTLDNQQVTELLMESKQTLEMIGMKVMVPKELLNIARPRTALRATASDTAHNYLQLADIVDFSWQVSLGEELLTTAEFRRLAKSAGRIVRFKDQYVYLDPETTAHILQQLAKPVPTLSAAEVLQAAFVGEKEGSLFSFDNTLQRLIDDLASVADIDPPHKLVGELRPYQLAGYRWAYSRLQHGFGCCLADDMGLGKTIQAIAVILKLKQEGKLTAPILLICPTTLAANWERECSKFAPSLKVNIFHGATRRLQAAGFDVIITTYNLARQERDRLQRRKWGLIILDEAQYIKNPESQQTKAIKSLTANGYLALTGTPVENRLKELWSIFSFLLPGYFGGVKSFTKRFARPIEKYNNQKAAHKLRLAASPFILRRMKTDKSIIDDLPDKIVEDEYCSLTKEQAALYQAVVDQTIRTIEESDGINRRGMIFKLLTSLKQICNHPIQYSKQGVPLAIQSGKARRTLEIIREYQENREKLLVFTQYKEMAFLLETIIGNELAVKPLVFHGALSRKQREDMIELFKSSKHHPVMIISLRAGGTGLNLTQATGVIHYDLWWNPAVENQATDRTYRIGQKNTVMVRRMITVGTFEEKINQMLQAKQEIAEMVLSGETGLTELSNEQLRELFALSEA